MVHDIIEKFPAAAEIDQQQKLALRVKLKMNFSSCISNNFPCSRERNGSNTKETSAYSNESNKSVPFYADRQCSCGWLASRLQLRCSNDPTCINNLNTALKKKERKRKIIG